VTEITVHELKRRRDANEDLMLLDVREPDELATASIAGATVIRMSDIPLHLDELPTNRPIVVMCHHGARSANVANFLNAGGYPNAVNLAGGIDAWAADIDPAVARY
jgi:rhodanese-related sulfurtransferase